MSFKMYLNFVENVENINPNLSIRSTPSVPNYKSYNESTPSVFFYLKDKLYGLGTITITTLSN
jgi:hypothetical protein